MRQVDSQGRIKCSRCGNFKHFDPHDLSKSEFGRNQRGGKDGRVRWVPMSWCKQCISEYNQERKGSKAHSRAEYYKTIQKYLPNDDEVIMYLEHRYGPKWIEQLAGTPAPVRNIPEPADANEPEEVLGKDGYPLGPWNEDM